MPTHDEEERLRAVALQNAQSILHARRRAEDALRSQSEWLRVTLSSIGDAVISTDVAGHVTFMNGVAELLTGWPQAEALGRPLSDVFHIVNEESRAPVESPAVRALQEGVIVGLANHTLLIARDGRARPIDDSAAPIRSDGGAAVGCVLVFRDVTDRRRAEAELREARDELERRVTERTAQLAKTSEFLHTLLENLQEGIVACDADGRLTLFNRATREFHGLPQEPLPAEQWADHYDLFRPDGATPMTRDEVPLFRALRGERVKDAEMVIAPRGGEPRTLLASGQAVRDGEGRVLGAVVSMHDISLRKRAEAVIRNAHDELETRVRERTAELARANAALQAEVLERRRQQDLLRASEERLAEELAAMSRLHDLIARLIDCRDPRTALKEVLDATITIIGTDMGYVQLFNPQHNTLEVVAQRGWDEHVLESFRTVSLNADTACGRAIRTGGRVVIEDVQTDPLYEPYREIAAAAGYRGVQATPMLARNGEPLGVLTTFHRLPHVPTERDQRILDLYTRQAVEFIERTRIEAALRQIAADLSEGDRRKNEFLAMLAHELRNPLAPIRNALQILRRTVGQDEAVKTAAAMMERQIAQMVRLVDDLLDVSRITRGKIELRRERVELASIVHQAVETCRPTIELAHHELKVQLPPQRVYVFADAVRLAQVFGNLLNNACKYTEPGGVISLTVELQGSQVVVSVKDTGIGIPADMLPKIFEMFTQVDQSLERSQGGLGIGLSLAKNLVEMHGGVVNAFSPGAGRGSEFVVRVPVLIESSDASSPGPDTPVAVVQPAPTKDEARRILVVDDNHDSAQTLAMLLELTGSQTRIAHDGLEAVQAAEAFRPHVILLDIGLPKLNGFEAARRIREHDWGQKMILVALTGWGQDQDRQASKDAGFNAHLVKPVDYDALMDLLARTSPTPV